MRNSFIFINKTSCGTRGCQSNHAGCSKDGGKRREANCRVGDSSGKGIKWRWVKESNWEWEMEECVHDAGERYLSRMTSGPDCFWITTKCKAPYTRGFNGLVSKRQHEPFREASFSFEMECKKCREKMEMKDIKDRLSDGFSSILTEAQA